MDLLRSKPYTRLDVDEAGRVRNADSNWKPKDPTAYGPSEARFEASTEDRQAPLRLKAGFRLTKVIQLDPPYQKDPEGHDITEETVVIPWTDCIMDNFTVREMTDPEKAARDAFYEAEEIAEEHAKQDKKPQYKKNVEKKVKDMMIAFGFPVPVQKDSIIQMVDVLQAQVTALLDDNKTKEAIALMSNIDALTNYRISLGDDIYAPFLGDGADNA